ncbi:MAG: MBL fold metallo-hydrolase [Bacteroidota bacterium]
MKKVLRNSFIVPSIIIFFLFGGYYSRAQSGMAKPLVDSLISIIRLNSKTLVIGLGADAITAIATQKGIVVIDAGISATLTSRYRKIIENEFQRNDFAYVVNTHGHHDHTFGNNAFAEAKIIAQRNAMKEMHAYWSDTAKVESHLFQIVNQYDKELMTMKKGSSGWSEAFSQKTDQPY